MDVHESEIQKLVLAARRHLSRNELHEAVARSTEAIRLDGRQAESYMIRAEAYRRLRKSDRALADLAVAIRIAPDRPAPYVIRADILRRRCLVDQAIADATQAILLDPHNAAAYSVRAQCRSAIGDHEGAEEDIHEMLLIDPTRPVPNLEPQVQSTEGSSESDPEAGHFWKKASSSDPRQQRDIFADGKSADRSLNSRPIPGVQDPAELLADDSRYQPELIPHLLSRGRTTKSAVRRTLSSVVVAFACLSSVFVGYYLSRVKNARPLNPDAQAVKSHQIADPSVENSSSSNSTASDEVVLEDSKTTPESPPKVSTETVKSTTTDTVAPQNPKPTLEPLAKVASETVKLRIAISAEGDCKLFVGREIPQAVERENDGLVPITNWHASQVVVNPDGNRESSHLRLHVKDQRQLWGRIAYFRAVRLPCELNLEVVNLKGTELWVEFNSVTAYFTANLRFDDDLRQLVNLKALCVRESFESPSSRKEVLNVEQKVDLSRPEEMNFQLPYTSTELGGLFNTYVVLKNSSRAEPNSHVEIRNVTLRGHNERTIGLFLMIQEGKVVVERVESEGLAARSGIRVGDIVIGANGKSFVPLESVDVTGVLGYFGVGREVRGREVRLDLLRNGKKVGITIVFD